MLSLNSFSRVQPFLSYSIIEADAPSPKSGRTDLSVGKIYFEYVSEVTIKILDFLLLQINLCASINAST